MTALEGRHMLITGGSEGIGLEVGRLAAQRGARVTLLARRDSVLADAAASIAGSAGVDVDSIVTISADVSDSEQVDAAVAAATARHGTVDILVCCAGYALPGYFADLPPDEFVRHMDVNYHGAVNAIRAVAPAMRQRRMGHVLVTSSTAGLIGVFGYSAYSPTKFALRGLAESLRAEFKADRVRVGIIYPPDTQTPGFDLENLHKPPETAAISGSITPITAEKMADRIISGIEKNRFAIFADPTTALVSRTGGFIGPILRAAMDRAAQRGRAAHAPF